MKDHFVVILKYFNKAITKYLAAAF